MPVGSALVRYSASYVFIGPVKPFFEDSSVYRKGLEFPVHGMMVRCPVRVHPFFPSGRWLKGLRFPVGYLSFPGAFHCAVLLYYACQICEVQYTMAIEGIKDSLVRTVVAKY